MGASSARSPHTALPPARLAVFAMIAGCRDRLHLSEFDGRVSGQCGWSGLHRLIRRVDGCIIRPLSVLRLSIFTITRTDAFAITVYLLPATPTNVSVFLAIAGIGTNVSVSLPVVVLRGTGNAITCIAIMATLDCVQFQLAVETATVISSGTGSYGGATANLKGEALSSIAGRGSLHCQSTTTASTLATVANLNYWHCQPETHRHRHHVSGRCRSSPLHSGWQFGLAATATASLSGAVPVWL